MAHSSGWIRGFIRESRLLQNRGAPAGCESGAETARRALARARSAWLGDRTPQSPEIAGRGETCNHNYMSTDKTEKHVSAVERLRGWFTGRMPAEWLDGALEVKLDREEITVIVPIAAPQTAEGASDAEQAAAWDGRSRRFREETRQHRIEIAQEAEHTYGRKVSWGVRSGDRTIMFTTFSVPVMTRLRQPERLVLDTLVDAGVARSRSDALAWCVRLVGEHEDAWLGELRVALQRVEQIRSEGPRSS